MNQNVIYIGIDVDDVQYHGSALDKGTGEASGASSRHKRSGVTKLPPDWDWVFHMTDASLPGMSLADIGKARGISIVESGNIQPGDICAESS